MADKGKRNIFIVVNFKDMNSLIDNVVRIKEEVLEPLGYTSDEVCFMPATGEDLERELSKREEPLTVKDWLGVLNLLLALGLAAYGVSLGCADNYSAATFYLFLGMFNLFGSVRCLERVTRKKDAEDKANV